MSSTIGTDIHEAARLLRAGQVVAIPTETVYGLAANAFDEAAVLSVFQVKRRPSFDPLIVHIARRSDLDRLVGDLPPGAEALMAAFWPGPLTLVLPKGRAVPDLVTSGLDTVGIRMPAHPIAQALLQELDFPLAAPSANPFGYVSPTTARHVADQLGDRIPYILDGGPCVVGIESTIIGWALGADDRTPDTAQPGRWVLYRPGGIPTTRIEEVIGRVPVPQKQKNVLPMAPGMMESHYAPHKPLHVGNVTALLTEHGSGRSGVLSFSTRYDAMMNEVLSPAGDLNEAARHLFAALRRLDAIDCAVILAEHFPEEGLGSAINDRLLRASFKRG